MYDFTIEDSMRFGRREGRPARRWALARQWVFGFTLAFACQSVFAQAMYRIKSIGYLGGCKLSTPYIAALNDAGQVTGAACNANGDSHAFLWKNDGTPMADLGPDELGSTSTGRYVNSSGMVVGDAQDSTGGFAFASPGGGAPMTKIVNNLRDGTVHVNAVSDAGWVTGTAYPLIDNGESSAFLWKNDGLGMYDLQVAGDPGEYGLGVAVNDAGQVAGDGGFIDYQYSYSFIWKNDGRPAQNLRPPGGAATTDVCCINASGQVAGNAQKSDFTNWHAVLWTTDGTAHDLGTLVRRDSRSWAVALNDSGQVAGWSASSPGRRAFVWLNNGTAMKNLGTFGGTISQSNDINTSGQVTGYAYFTGDALRHAFLWRNDGTKIQDLNTLLDPTDPLKPYVTLTSGSFINNFGDILADGTDSRTGVSTPYLLQGTVLTLAPRSLAFGNQRINTTSVAKSVTMTNTSPKPVAIVSIALTGTAAGQFASTNNCGKSLAGHAICTIKVTFKPTTKGAKSAFLNVNGGGGGLRTVTLTGTST